MIRFLDTISIRVPTQIESVTDGTATIGRYFGTGTPEGSVTANVGSQYVDISNGHVWRKDSGVGNTGWLDSNSPNVTASNLITGTSGGAAPGAGVGSDGEYFHDLTDGKVYGPKAAGAWPGAAVADWAEAHRFTQLIGDGASLNYTVTHNLNTQNVSVTIRDAATHDLVMATTKAATVNTVTLDFAIAPTSNAFSVTVFSID